MSDIANKVETLMEAMPYLQKYQGKIIVIKYGGNAMINEELKDAVMHDVVLLKLLGMKPVLSHGGGPGINKMLEKLNIPVEFIEGLRYTSAEIMRVVEMVLVGQVNTELVGFINKLGGKAVEALVGPKAKALRDSIVMVGTMVIGAVGATWVSITCSPNLVLPGGGKFQDTLDGIYPHLLPMVFIIFCWYMMTKKKVNPIVMMLILVVIAFVGVLIGFFDPALSY